MKIVDVERILVDVPFTRRQQRITRRTVYNWSILELCKLTSDSGHVGWGETVVHYTHARVSDQSVARVMGQNPARFLHDDSLGAGLQIALFDLVGKYLEIPAHRLLGTPVRKWTPISWWCSHAAPQDWVAEAQQALQYGYTSLKTKPRPWWDIHHQMQSLAKAIPDHFKLDLDPNGCWRNVAAALPLIKDLENYDQIARFETPIPQHDLLGNQELRRHIHRPLAMHFGIPAYITTVRQALCDGFVINGGASQVCQHAALSAEAEMPFWLQLVGNGLTTTWAAHLGAVLSHAIWPTISCYNLYSHSLLKKPINIVGGYQPVPEAPGLGVEIDTKAIEKFRIPLSKLKLFPNPLQPYKHPRPRLINTVIYPSGKCIHMAALDLNYFTSGNGPVYAAGARVEGWEEDGTNAWKNVWQRVQKKPLRGHWEGFR